MSLQDQLLKAGLVNEKKVNKAKKSSKKSRSLRKEVKAATEEAKASQLAKDKAANQKIKQEAEKKALAAQIKQLINLNAINLSESTIEYRFTDENLVKTVLVNDLQQKQLANGLLCIAKLNETYKVIPSAVADKIIQRDDSYIVVLNQKSEEQLEEDDPYADFQVPDDLMW
ncbi:DUF2058 domain-containing protein [Algibacillus agarilyticus]|uniref:DUF2058 domain-containing protein n=1 Tax=Algibacillus agarilyticus TaxID=2234133 RepID=UPI000DCF6C91|nr:DUF2058 domain-containing protein [Algibacillus agarilyticus]